HDACEVCRSESAIEGTDARPGLTESRIVCSNRQIADDMQHVTAADRVACDHRDHRLRKTSNLFLDIENVEPRNAFGVDVAGFAAYALIATGTERLVPLAGEDHHADVGVVAREIEGLLQFADRLGPEGIAHLGTIDRDLANAVFRPLIFDVAELANGGPH